MPTLNWIGKEKVVNHHQDVPFRVLDHKYGFTAENGRQNFPVNSGNMIIHGDNLEALKSLLPKYEGKIKCIYIDPPYNTGNEGWIYNDNVNHPKIKRWLGEVVGKQGEDLTRHDKWLCMMYPRLKLLHKLLAEDGVIFSSIDDNEHANLKLLCDEIFGQQNFVVNIACINNPKGRSDQKYIATAHEHIVVYKKSNNVQFGGFEAGEHIKKRYNKIDSDGRKWREIDLRKTGDNDQRTDRPNMYYPIYWHKNTLTISFEQSYSAQEIYPMKSEQIEGRWRWGKDTAIKNANRLYARYMPAKKQWSVFEKDYLDETEKIKATSVWDFKDVNSERGTETFVKLLGFNKNDFPKPKPVGTVERILQLSTSIDSLVLDSFAGSGTTAHAVLNLNKADGGDRKIILIEMEDYAETTTAERVKRVIKGFGETKGTGGDFNFYTLGSPIFKEDNNLNEDVGEDKIREYIYYTETKQHLEREQKEEQKYLLDTYNNTGYYFYYEKDQLTTLSLETLNIVTERAEQYLIYADHCLLDKDYMLAKNIIFKKIPRDIKRF